MAPRITVNSSAPVGWCCYINGQYYRVGNFNRIFVYRFGEWISTRGVTLDEINKAIKAKNHDVAAPTKRREYVRKDKTLPPIHDKASAKAARDAMIERMKVRSIE